LAWRGSARHGKGPGDEPPGKFFSGVHHMVSPILRQKVRGRHISPVPQGWGGIPESLRRWKVHHFGQSPIPPGYRFDGKVAKIPLKHQSNKELQDIIEQRMIKEMNAEAPGRRKDFLVNRYNYWVQNGRPVYGQPGPRSKPSEFRLTNKESTLWMDEVEDAHPRSKRRIYLKDVIGSDGEGRR